MPLFTIDYQLVRLIKDSDTLFTLSMENVKPQINNLKVKKKLNKLHKNLKQRFKFLIKRSLPILTTIVILYDLSDMFTVQRGRN